MKLSVVLISVLAVAATGGAVHADNKDKADALFKQGKKLMGEKRYADACEAFEKSYKLDPGIGAQLNIAKCYEEWGKIGRAFVAYQAAEKMATDANDSRAPKIHELVVKLEPSVPHLTIKLPKNAPSDVTVTLDSRPVETIGEPFVVDPGPHTIEWTYKGSTKKSKVVPIDRGGESEITLDVPKGGGDPGAGQLAGGGGGGGGEQGGDTGTDKIGEVPEPTPPGRNQRFGGLALAGGGVIAIGVSSYMALSAKSKYSDALDMYCDGMANNCDMTGLEITHDARSTANKATIVFIVGAAMVGGGVALYVLAPKGPATTQEKSVYITPAIGPDGVGVVFGGKL
jgi:tetratricopeptide (TPR) repeat protein